MNFSFNPLSIVTGAVESACHALLPKELAFVGDLVGLASDVQSGNVLKGLADIRDLNRDLAQPAANAAGTGDTGTVKHDSTAQFSEPTPPPPYRRYSGFSLPPPASNTVKDGPVIRGAPPALSSASASPPAPDAISTSTPVSTSTEDTAPSSAPPIPLNLKHVAKSPNISALFEGKLKAVAGQPTPGGTDPAGGDAARVRDSSKNGAPSSSTAVVDAAGTDHRTAAEASPAAVPIASTASTSATSGVVTDTTSADGFFKLSDKDLMNAVRDGKIPDSVSKDPEQMRRLQMRINDISEMNQLITTMLSTLHELSKQIIQNLHA